MSKKSRRRNRALGVIAGLMGAKALGLLGSKTAATSGASKIVGKTPEFRKSFVKPKAKVVQNLMPDINKSMKSANIKKLADESITNLNPRTRIGSINRMKLMAAKKDPIADDVINLVKRKTNRIGFNRSKGGTIIKARGGGMARTKPTKMY